VTERTAKIQAVLFDLDDTLTDDDTSFRESVVGTADGLARQHPGLSASELVDAYWRESTAVWTAFDMEMRAGRAPEAGTGDRLRHEAWRRALAACGVQDEGLVRRAVVEYAGWRDRTLRVAPGAVEVLDALRPRLRTAIITNGPTDMQRDKLRRFDLESRVDCTAISEEFGLGKPNPAIFLHVADTLRVTPADCIMVGDYLNHDVAGAHAAGMRAVWVNRHGRPVPAGGPVPDFAIVHLREVLDIVRAEGA
jgi:HAD superfamily hydrolase (TIGR01509 family)